jgi:hypothetical protein
METAAARHANKIGVKRHSKGPQSSAYGQLYWNGNRAQTQKSYSGLEDEVDNRWGELFKAALLSTVLSVGAELGSGADTGNNQPFFRRCGSAPRIH